MACYLNTIKWNDCVNGNGIVVSLWFQGCPHNPKCNACHNPESHSYDTNLGYEYTQEIENKIIEGLTSDGTIRNLSLLGGEPFSTRNLKTIDSLIQRVRRLQNYHEIIIWTGYTIEELISFHNVSIDSVLKNIDYLIDGKFKIAHRDITLKWRGSPNQRILNKKDIFDKFQNL